MRSVSADVSLSYLDCSSVACFCQRSVSVSFEASISALSLSSSLALWRCEADSELAFLSAVSSLSISSEASSTETIVLLLDDLVTDVSPVSGVPVSGGVPSGVSPLGTEGVCVMSIIPCFLSCCQDDRLYAGPG